MTNTTGPLLHLLADLTRDGALRERLVDHPPAVIEQYGISPDTQKLLRGGDTDQIVDQIAREARALIGRLRDQPVNVTMPWAGPAGLEVKTCAPTSGPVDSPVAVTVTGTGFDVGARLWFSAPSGYFDASDTQVSGNGTVITGQITLKTPGSYDVTVSNSATASGTLPAGYTATAK
jgi:hypothetical protein